MLKEGTVEPKQIAWRKNKPEKKNFASGQTTAVQPVPKQALASNKSIVHVLVKAFKTTESENDPKSEFNIVENHTFTE